MNVVHCLPGTAESNAEDCPESFRGHSVGASFSVRLASRRSDQSNWVKVGQTDSIGQAGRQNRLQINENEQLAE